jgi:hypothetical protein
LRDAVRGPSVDGAITGCGVSAVLSSASAASSADSASCGSALFADVAASVAAFAAAGEGTADGEPCVTGLRRDADVDVMSFGADVDVDAAAAAAGAVDAVADAAEGVGEVAVLVGLNAGDAKACFTGGAAFCRSCLMGKMASATWFSCARMARILAWKALSLSLASSVLSSSFFRLVDTRRSSWNVSVWK